MGRFPKAQLAIAGVIRDARKRAGKSARGLSEALGESQHFVRRIETGERDISTGEFMAIANELGVRPSTLLTRVERRLKG
jgi:transcriptional regulator with XRE-family HTH domain